MQKILTIRVQGPDIIIDLVERALAESKTVQITPDSISPGYVLDVI